MAIEYISWFVLLGLVIASYLDIKKKIIPSPLTTSILFVTAIVKMQNIEFGLLGAIFGLLMMEGITENGEFFSGLADLKMTVVLSLFMTTIPTFLILCVLIMFIGLGYKIVAVQIFKKKGDIALLPVFVIAFIIMALIGQIKLF